MEEIFIAIKQLDDFLKLIKPRIGPSPKFSASHAIMCLYKIAERQPIGRKKLSEELGIGEGSTRSLLDRLRSIGLLQISKKGIILSKKGEKFLEKLNVLMSRPKRVFVQKITIGRVNIAILIRGFASRVKNGMRIRDAAVSQGATGATTLVFLDGKLRIPGVSQDVEIDFPEEVKSLIEELKPREGDVIVLGTAEGSREAELGAIAGVVSLLEIRW